MAILEREQRGQEEIVRIQGRVMKVKHEPKPGEKPPRELRMICVLSGAGARALTELGIAQPCFGNCYHSHHTRALVERLVRDGLLRWLGKGKNVAAYTGNREWKAMPSGALEVKVLQLV